MTLNAEFIASKPKETKDFYQRVLNFGTSFECDFLRVHADTPPRTALAFLLPDNPSPHQLFQPPFEGKGAFITVELPDADAEYHTLLDLNIPIEIPIRNGLGRSPFAVVDPKAIGIDFATDTTLMHIES